MRRRSTPLVGLLLAGVACRPPAAVVEPAPPKHELKAAGPSAAAPRQAVPDRTPGLGVRPTIEVAILDAGGTCDVRVDAIGFPAFDPEGRQVLTLERSIVQLVDFDVGSLELVWRDADTQAVTSSMPLLGPIEEGTHPCEDTHRRAQASLDEAHHRMDRTRWEAMPEVPIEFIKFAAMHFEIEAELRAEAEAAGEVHSVPHHVRAYSLDGRLIVELPGVAVLEQQATFVDEEAISVHRAYGHRPSGTVVFTEVDCLGEDCTCDPGTSSTIVQWSPETLSTIDAHPCGADEDDLDAAERCEIASGFVDDVDPWSL